MRRRAWRGCSFLVAFVSFVGFARAEPPATIESADDLCSALESMRLSAALDASKSVLENEKDDPSVAYICAAAARAAISDVPEAIRLYRRATELAPDFMLAHYGLAETLINVDVEQAKKHLARTIELNTENDPDVPALEAVFARIERFKRGTKLNTEPGSATAGVQKIVDFALKNSVGDTLLRYANPAVMQLAKQAGLENGSPRALAQFAEGAATGMRNSLLGKDASFLGAEPIAERPLDDGGTAVTLAFMAWRRWTPQQVAALREGYSDPRRRAYLEPDTKATIDALSEGYRREFYANLQKHRTFFTFESELWMRKEDSKWVIYDFRIGEMGIAETGELYRTVVKPKTQGRSQGNSLAESLGRLAGSLLVIFGIVYLVRRARK